MVNESGKLDAIAGQVTAVLVAIAKLEGRIEQAVDGHGDHETRLRALERSKWLAVGFAAAAGGLAGKLAGLL
jgi:hypothetical protein